MHSVRQTGSLQTVTHSGHFPFSQCSTGQRTCATGKCTDRPPPAIRKDHHCCHQRAAATKLTSHCGGAHLTSHLLQGRALHVVVHRGTSQTGSQI
jgi:hypothetical protein